MNINPRFRNKEDADLFMECLQNKTPYPPEKWVWPFEMRGDLVFERDEYEKAPFELRLT